MTIARQADGLAGWEHLLPGQPIKTVLDETTRYSNYTQELDVRTPLTILPTNNAPGTDTQTNGISKTCPK